MTERRGARRRPFRGEVEVLEQVHGHTGTAIARDISVNGMFLMTVAPYRIGDVITVRFLLPSSSCRIEVAGKVVRREPPREGLDPSRVGVAVRFDDADEWALAEVTRYVGQAPRLAGYVTATPGDPDRPPD